MERIENGEAAMHQAAVLLRQEGFGADVPEQEEEVERASHDECCSMSVVH